MPPKSSNVLSAVEVATAALPREELRKIYEDTSSISVESAKSSTDENTSVKRKFETLMDFEAVNCGGRS